MDVTEKKLAAALDGQWVYARNRDGTHHAQVVNYSDVAADLMEKLGPSPAPSASGDLDRAYVINGDDLRHVLAGMTVWCKPQPGQDLAHEFAATISRPESVARTALAEIEVAGAVAVSERQLAAALEEDSWVRVRSTAGGMGTSSAPLADAAGFAKSLFAQLSANAAHESEPDPDVVDAHICCEHAEYPDRELHALAAATAALNANDWRLAIRLLCSLPLHERARATVWLADRFPSPPDELPF